MRPRLAGLTFVSVAAVSGLATAQSPPSSATEAVRVFLDCQFECDGQYLRTEINYVNWVLDRTVSDVHILVASEETGGGGRRLSLRFIGQRTFAGVDDELTQINPATATSDERRKDLVQVVKLGLVRYLARTPDGAKLQVSMPAAAQAAAQGQGLKPHDPWNNRVFTVAANTYLNGESQQRFSNLSSNVGADKVTDLWKISFAVSGSRNSSRFTLPDSSVFRDRTSYYAFDAFAGRSLGDHWSLGMGVNGFQSTRSNIDLSLRTGPQLEFNFFKYSAATRHRLTMLYQVSAVHFDYQERTLFDRVQEVVVQQSLGLAGRARQPWGDVSGSITANAYLHDLSKNTITLFSSANLRIAKGLDLNLFGQYSRIRDQLGLRAGGASRDEILRQLRELRTGYRYFLSLGMSYRFGSIFNNVVNPRFSSRGGGGNFFFSF